MDCLTVTIQLAVSGKSKTKIFIECQQDISPLVGGPHVRELCHESFFQSCHVNSAVEFDSKLLQPGHVEASKINQFEDECCLLIQTCFLYVENQFSKDSSGHFPLAISELPCQLLCLVLLAYDAQLSVCLTWIWGS